MEPTDRLHVVRVDAGARHYDKDWLQAPEPADRVPGHCYSTLNRHKGASSP
ncbi:hypothetical protein ACIQVR_37500 [Streptomyces xanthochromogenes]|uniref:hypothetical protein n=1 Tax=Streptomyces xanthochromogenes TaxID=67384 RepID=UPI00381644DC